LKQESLCCATWGVQIYEGMVGGMEPRVFDFSKKEKQVEVGIIKILPQKWKTWNSGLIIKKKKKNWAAQYLSIYRY